jgi:uncharacterized membrane protein YoaK (UPF0700 family)
MFSRPSSLADYNSKNIVVWMSMAFQAGSINAGGFLACHRFVSHVTGFATHFGAEVSYGHIGTAFGTLSVPAYFLLGAMLAAFFVDKNLTKGKPAKYTFMFLIISFSMFVIAVGGSLGLLGKFGESPDLISDYFLLSVLCLCSGIQNATITSASGAVVRTTHLTGITTDLGIGIVRTISASIPKPIRQMENRANAMRSGIIVFFILGSLISSFCFLNFDYKGFFIPCLISAMLAYISHSDKQPKEKHGT